MNTPGKLVLLGALYFSQGLPFGFFTQGLPVILRHKGYTLGAIGLSGLLAAPWALKWLWAPLVDRAHSPRFGRRKSWIVPLQLLTVALLSVQVAGYRLGMIVGGGALLIWHERLGDAGTFAAMAVLTLLATLPLLRLLRARDAARLRHPLRRTAVLSMKGSFARNRRKEKLHG